MTEGKEATRRRMLDAGVGLWSAEPPAELFGGMSVARIAKSAGVTRSTFYAYWSSTEEYLLDLALHLSEPGRGMDPRIPGEGFASLIRSAPRLAQRFIDVCENYVEALAADPRLRVRFGLFSKVDDPEIADVLRQAIDHTEAIRATQFRALLPWGRQPRPPLTGDHLHAVGTALAEGLVVRHILDPERYPARLYGMTMLAMLLVLTGRPDDERHLETVLEVANDWVVSSFEQATRVPKDDRGLSDFDVTELTRTARRLASSEGWLNLSLGGLAMLTRTSEARVNHAFGSKMGLGLAMFLLTLSERYDELEPSDDPLADLRRLFTIAADELKRNPAYAQSIAVLIASGASFSPPASYPFDPEPVVVVAVRRAQDAGLLDPMLDADHFAALLNRTNVLANVPAIASLTANVDGVDLLLRGAAPKDAPLAPLT